MSCARCSSTSGCGCLVVGGTNVTVSGFGTPTSPWVISATGGGGGVETPFTGIAAGLVSITPGGVAGHAPTIDVTCEAVQDCVSPMMLGNGFAYDDAGGQWDTTGTSGQVLTANGVGGATWTNKGVETPAGVLYPDTDADGRVEVGVRYDGANGSTTPTFNPATGEWIICSPSGGGVPGAASQFAANFPSCADINGTRVYQTATGLRGVPEHTSVIGSVVADINPGGLYLDGTPNWPAQATSFGVALPFLLLVNPSTCRSMNWYHACRSTVFVASAGHNGASIDGFGGGNRFPLASVWNSGVSATFPGTESNHLTAINNGVIGPGVAFGGGAFQAGVGNGITDNFYALRSMNPGPVSISGFVQAHFLAVTI